MDWLKLSQGQHISASLFACTSCCTTAHTMAAANRCKIHHGIAYVSQRNLIAIHFLSAQSIFFCSLRMQTRMIKNGFFQEGKNNVFWNKHFFFEKPWKDLNFFSQQSAAKGIRLLLKPSRTCTKTLQWIFPPFSKKIRDLQCQSFSLQRSWQGPPFWEKKHCLFWREKKHQWTFWGETKFFPPYAEGGIFIGSLFKKNVWNMGVMKMLFGIDFKDKGWRQDYLLAARFDSGWDRTPASNTQVQWEAFSVFKKKNRFGFFLLFMKKPFFFKKKPIWGVHMRGFMVMLTVQCVGVHLWPI